MNYVELIPRLLLGLLFQWWGVWLAIAVFAALIVARRAPRTDVAPFTRRVARLGGLAIAVSWALMQLAPMFASEPWRVMWWLMLPPAVVASTAVAIILARTLRDPSTPEVPVTPVVRRGWLSFTRRRDWAVTASAFGALLALSVAAGLASSPDDDGLYSRISIPVGDQGAGSSTFFGWAYSVPLVIVTTVLLVLLYLALRSNAGRPFRRPDTVGAETEQRRTTSVVLFALAGASVLIGLSDAVLMVAHAGLGSVGVGIPGVGTFMYSTGFASLAPALLVIGSLLQSWAALWLLLTISGRSLSARAASRS